MRIFGPGELGRRAQYVVRNDPRFKDVLAAEEDGTLCLYQPLIAVPNDDWTEYYSAWARLTPVDKDKYRLDHLALSGQWQELDVVRSLEACMHAISQNVYHLFFL